MELLLALEKKVISLVEVGRRLQAENLELRDECQRLQLQVETLERSLLTHGQRADEIEQAKLLVDDLIRNIDLVVERETERLDAQVGRLDAQLVKEQEKHETPS